MFAFIVFKYADTDFHQYGRVYHYSNQDELNRMIETMKNNGHLISAIQENITNFIVA